MTTQAHSPQPEYIGILEHSESVYTITHTEAHIIASTACNAGLIPHFKIAYDHDFTLDENLQSLIEHMTEAEAEARPPKPELTSWMTFVKIDHSAIEVMSDTLHTYHPIPEARKMVKFLLSRGWNIETYESIVGLEVTRLWIEPSQKHS